MFTLFYVSRRRAPALSALLASVALAATSSVVIERESIEVSKVEKVNILRFYLL